MVRHDRVQYRERERKKESSVETASSALSMLVCIWIFLVLFSLASASNAYIGSVLFRASAFIAAKLASGEPAVIGRFGP